MEQKMIDSIVPAIHTKMPEYIKTLSDLVSIPSISFDNFDQKYVLESAEAVKQLFLDAGLTNVQFLLPPSGRPSVYGLPAGQNRNGNISRTNQPEGRSIGSESLMLSILCGFMFMAGPLLRDTRSRIL